MNIAKFLKNICKQLLSKLTLKKFYCVKTCFQRGFEFFTKIHSKRKKREWKTLYNKRVITWSRFAGMKFCPALPQSLQYSKLFINFIMWLHEKSFIPARRDPAFVLLGSRFAGTTFSHVIIPSRPSGMKNQLKACVWRYFCCVFRYFYCVFFFMWRQSVRKMLTNDFVVFHHFTEAATEDALQKRCS